MQLNSKQSIQNHLDRSGALHSTPRVVKASLTPAGAMRAIKSGPHSEFMLATYGAKIPKEYIAWSGSEVDLAWCGGFVDGEAWVGEAVLRTLDAQAGQCSVATQMRLNEARARAIAATHAKIPFWRRTPLLAAAFALSAAYTFVVLTQTHTEPTSAELEAAALYEATFGDVADEVATNRADFFDAKLDPTALDTDLDETLVANELEFYAWLSETSAQRAPQANTPGSDS